MNLERKQRMHQPQMQHLNGSFHHLIDFKFTILNLERTILFETNQTGAWLSGLDDSTKKHYMEIARKSAKAVLKDYQKHKMDIEKRTRQDMLAKQKKC